MTMKRIGTTAAALLLCLGMGTMMFMPIYAEEDEDGNRTDTEANSETVPAEGENERDTSKAPHDLSSIEYVLSSDPESAGTPISVRPAVPEAEHRMIFDYTESTVIRGVFGQSAYFFKVAKYWNVRYALAQIEYSISPMIDNVPASVTFFINNTPIYSCAVNYELGATQIAYVLIPVELLEEGYNNFTISGFVRLYDDDGCLDDLSGANWISISKNSFIEVGYDVIETNNQISYYPYPLISTMDETGNNLNLYVPENASEEELKAAFMLRADLGDETVREDDIGFMTFAHYVGTKNALIISEFSHLPDAVKSQMPSMSRDLSAGAIIYEYENDGRAILVLTSENPECLSEGAALLMDEDRVTQEKSNWAYIPAGAAEQVVMNRSLSSLIEDGETIEGITDYEGLSFIGPFHQEQTIYLPFSGGFILGEGGKIDLRLRYSDNLDFDRSLITVYWGDKPVASKKLEKDKCDSDTFSFMMPSDAVGTHAASIKIAYDLEVKDQYCTKRADEMPWGYVSGDSVLYLPVGASSTYDLSLRPYPFQQLGSFNNLAIVIPDSMSDTEYAMFGRIAALLGSNVSPYGDLKIWAASRYPAETENRHVVALGTYRSNEFIQKINNRLSFKYSESGDCFLSNEQLILGDRYSREMAVLQIIRSPWQKGRAILTVSAVDDTSLSSIERFASVQENTWTLAGDAFLIDRDLETKHYRFLKDEAVHQASLRERIAQNKNAILFTLISTFAMILILAAILIVAFRFRKNKAEEEKK